MKKSIKLSLQYIFIELVWRNSSSDIEDPKRYKPCVLSYLEKTPTKFFQNNGGYPGKMLNDNKCNCFDKELVLE